LADSPRISAARRMNEWRWTRAAYKSTRESTQRKSKHF
jgi:hypothetical protein